MLAAAIVGHKPKRVCEFHPGHAWRSCNLAGTATSSGDEGVDRFLELSRDERAIGSEDIYVCD